MPFVPLFSNVFPFLKYNLGFTLGCFFVKFDSRFEASSESLQIVTLVTNENIAQTAISVIVMLLAKLTNKASEKIEVRQRVMDNYKTVLKAYVKVRARSFVQN